MPDILHWLGIKKIDRMLSMSKYVPPFQRRLLLKVLNSMKHDAIVGQGYVIFQSQELLLSPFRIPIHERVELPESWMPADSRVEIDAKITAG